MTQNTYDIILRAAVQLSRHRGYCFISRDDIAAYANVGAGTVNMHFQTMETLRQEVLKQAVSTRILEIVALGLALREPVILQAPKTLRKAATDYLLSL